MKNSRNLNTIKKIAYVLILVIVCLLIYETVHSPINNQSLSLKSVNKKADIIYQKQMQNSGEWNATILRNNIKMEFKSNQIDGISNVIFSGNELFPNLSSRGESFTINRDAGSIILKGTVKEGHGQGTYLFSSNKVFDENIRKLGVITDKNDLFAFCLMNVRNELLTTLQKYNLVNISISDLELLSMLNITSDYVKMLEKYSVTNLSIHDIISAKTARIDESNLELLKSDSRTGVVSKELIHYNDNISDNQTQKKLIEMPKSQIGNADNLNVQSTANLGDPYIRNQLPLQDVLHVPLKYVNDLKNLGYSNVPFETLIMLQASNVSVKYISDFIKLGYKNEKLDEFIPIKNLGVDPLMIKEYGKLGFGKIPLKEVVYLKLNNVTPKYIITMKKKGHISMDLNEYVALSHFQAEQL